MTDDPWRDPQRVSAAKAGVAAARRRNRVEIVRTGATYVPQCCGKHFRSWHLAGEHVIEGKCDKERGEA